MNTVTSVLQYVANVQEIRQSIVTFNASAQKNRGRGLNLLRQTSYWVFDGNTQCFGPAKFIGLAEITFEAYEAAIQGDWSGDRFDGYHTRVAIEHVTGLSFSPSELLAHELVKWGERLFGPGAFDGIEESKWCFVRI